MSLEDIKSPLPPRKVSFESEAESEETNQRISLVDSQEVSVQTPVISQTANDIPQNNKKLIIILVGIIILILIGLFFILSKNRNTTEQITLNYWGLWEEESVMNGIIAAFENKNPNINIEYKRSQKDGYGGRLSGRLSKNSANEEIPDIFRIHNTWIPMFRNNLAPVPKETVSNLGLETDFFDIYKKDLKENNQYLAIPLMYDGLALFYNTDLLNKAQVNVPTNWWDLEKSAERLTQRDKNGKIKIAGAAIGLVENVDHWSDIVGLMMKQNGVDFTKKSSENEKKIKDVIDFYTLFRTKGNVWDETLPNSTEYFASGNLAFYFAPSWRIFDIETMNPNLKFEVAKVPQLPTLGSASVDKIDPTAELTNIHWGTYWVEGVNNKSKYQKEAWKFLEYLGSVQGLEKMYQADSQIRSFGQIYPRKSMANKLNTIPKIKTFVETANNATSWYLASNTGDNGVNTEMQKYFTDAINSNLSQNNVDNEAIITLQNGISQLQQKYKLIK